MVCVVLGAWQRREQAIPLFLFNKGTAAMHPEVLVYSQQPGVLFSRELPEEMDTAEEVCVLRQPETTCTRRWVLQQLLVSSYCNS